MGMLGFSRRAATARRAAAVSAVMSAVGTHPQVLADDRSGVWLVAGPYLFADTPDGLHLVVSVDGALSMVTASSSDELLAAVSTAGQWGVDPFVAATLGAELAAVWRACGTGTLDGRVADRVEAALATACGTPLAG